MDDLVRMDPDDFSALSDQMRLANTQRIKMILDNLEPFCDGSVGMPSPPHVMAYLKAVRELGLLWKAYERPQAAQVSSGVDEEQLVLEARQAQVVDELAKLRAIRSRRGSAS